MSGEVLPSSAGATDLAEPVAGGQSGEAERQRLARFKHFRDDMMGYMQIQGTRPRTLANGLTDSPAGHLAWIVEKFKEWTDPAAKLPEDAVDRERILTNVSVNWFTHTAGSSANLYYETLHNPDAKKRKTRNTVPTGVAVSLTQDVTIRRWAERENNIVHCPSSTAVDISSHWKYPTSWLETCGSSFDDCADSTGRAHPTASYFPAQKWPGNWLISHNPRERERTQAPNAEATGRAAEAAQKILDGNGHQSVS